MNAALAAHAERHGLTDPLKARRSLASLKLAQELDARKRASVLRHVERWNA